MRRTFLYGQLSVFTRDETAALLRQTAAALRPGGKLVIELLDYERIDKTNSNFWFTDDRGLWGDRPFLMLGERFWDGEQRTAIDRFHVIDLESGAMQVIGLPDCGYETEEMLLLLLECGFTSAEAYPGLGRPRPLRRRGVDHLCGAPLTPRPAGMIASLHDLRILVIADDPLARAGLAAILAAQPGCQVVGQVASDADLAG